MAGMSEGRLIRSSLCGATVWTTFVARQKRGFIRIMLAAAGRKGLIAINYIAGSRHKIEWQSHTVNLK